jgi:hypothetical protein
MNRALAVRAVDVFLAFKEAFGAGDCWLELDGEKAIIETQMRIHMQPFSWRVTLEPQKMMLSGETANLQAYGIQLAYAAKADYQRQKHGR